jgi:hypothetical protein
MPRKASDMSSDKHVRFAISNVYHSAPPTPSPAFSDISLPEPEFLLTPPTFTTLLPPAPEPFVMRIHGTLAYRPAVNPILAWDISSPPANALPVGALGVSPSQFRPVLAEAATNPPLPEMTILTAHLPYKITIRAGVANGASSPWTPQNVPLPMPGMPSSPSAQHVTVYDVMVGLYTFLRIPLSPAEYAALSQPHQQALAAAFGRRVSQVQDPAQRQLEHSKGVKRIDYLSAAGRTGFLGIGATKKGNDIWVLNLA